jgi:prepilin-type N-terminal cleavage/methylation domain-containing protein
MLARTSTGRAGASLIELLVVLFIMGIMMGLLFPAIQNARARVSVTVCQNNVYQLQHALSQFINAKRRFPLPGRWSVDLLPWIEQRELAYAIDANRDPNARFDRPKLFHCPLQEDFESRLPGVGVSHYMLVVNRQALVADDDAQVGWQIQDRPRLDDDVPEEPWFVGPEVLPTVRDEMMATLPGPHQGGEYGH